MIKLHPETAQAIATLINQIDVSVIMARDEDTSYWMAKEFKAIIRLTEDYGIPHTSYDHAIRCMKMDMYANATLLTEAA